MERACTKCNIVQPIENLPWKNQLPGKRHAVCKTCTAERSKRLYQEDKTGQPERVGLNNQRYWQIAREFIVDYFSTHSCTECGEMDYRVLEFHHLGEREGEVSRLIGRGASLDALIAEIARCQVLCENCHGRLPAEKRGWINGRSV